MEIEFRSLTKNDIELKTSVKDNYIRVLLYKNARCDMSILDETVGNDNWQRKQTMLGPDLFCSIGINVNYESPDAPKEWIWKEDVGSFENASFEKAKTRASDAFKRAATNWGIGRELYTAPQIIIPANMVNGTLEISDIQVSDHKITHISINDKTSGAIVFDSAQEPLPTKRDVIQKYASQLITFGQHAGKTFGTLSLEQDFNRWVSVIMTTPGVLETLRKQAPDNCMALTEYYHAV